MRFERHSLVSTSVYAALDHLVGVTVFHTAEWHRVLSEAFGWRVSGVTLHDPTGAVCGFLPYVRKRRMGRPLNVSLPLSHDVGLAHREELDVAGVELPMTLRPLDLHADQAFPGTRAIAEHWITELDLDGTTPDSVVQQFEGDVRRRLRVAERSGVEVEVRDDLAAFVEFDRLQCLTRRRQGAPTYPKRFFPSLARNMAARGMAVAHLVKVHERVVAGVVFFLHAERAIYAYGASVPDRELWRLGINQVAMVNAIRHAMARGCTSVDFGSSPMSQPALREYKETFGGVSRPLVHRVIDDDSGRRLDVRQDGRLAALGGLVLRRLPLPAFRALSPPLLRMVC